LGGITSSSDGNRSFAGSRYDYIMSFILSPQAFNTDILLPQPGNNVSTWNPIISWSTATSCYYSYNNWVSTSTANCALSGSDILPPPTSGSVTLSIKGIDAGGVVKTNTSTFTYAPHYWCGTADSNWTNVSNWYTDATCSVGKGSIPTNTSGVFLVGNTSPIISWSTTTLPLFIDSTGLTGGANTAGVIFAGTAYNSTKIVGNVTFNGTTYNTGAITGNAIFSTGSNGTFTLSGSMKWGGTIGGIIKGGDTLDITNLIFNNSSTNETTIENTITAVFNNSASNNGVINGNVTFNNTGLFTMGTVNGTATMNGLSQTLNGVNNVINFVKSVASSIKDTLFLTSGSVLNISGTTTMQGHDANNLLTIQSTIPGIEASLGINGTSTLNYLRIKDINNTGANINLASSTVFNDGGNTGFTFDADKAMVPREGMTSPYLNGAVPIFPGIINSCGNLYFAGTYTLGGNVVGSCNVLAPGIIISGAGHTLTGDVTANEYGVTLSNITVTGAVSTTGAGAGTTTVNSASNLTGSLTVTGILAGDGSSSVGSTTIASTGVVATSSVSFVGEVTNNGIIYSGNSVVDRTINNGVIYGNFVFNPLSVNSGVVNGNAIFNLSAINRGTVTGTARFNMLTSTAGVITFSSSTVFAGTGVVLGNVYDSTGVTVINSWIFNDSSSNTGVLKGNAVFNNTSSATASSSITGDALVYSPVVRPLGGAVLGTLTYYGYPVLYFNDTAAGHGTAGKWDDVLNWWTDAAFTIHSPVVPSSGDNVIINGNITNSSSTASVISAIFEGTSSNGITITVSSPSTEAALFNASSTNNGTIIGNATFSGPDTDSPGSVTGGITRLYDAGTYVVIKDFTANGLHWVIKAVRGAIVDLAGSTYSTVTNKFQALNNGIFHWNMGIGFGAPHLVITSPVVGTNIKWAPVIAWGTNRLCQYKINNGSYISVNCANNGSDIPRPAAGTTTTMYFRSTDNIQPPPRENITEKSITFTYDNTQPVDTDCSTPLDEITRPYYYLSANVTNNCSVTATTTLKGDDGLGHFYTLSGNLTGAGFDINIINLNATGSVSSFGAMTVASSTLLGSNSISGTLNSDATSTFASTTIAIGAVVNGGNFVNNLTNNGTIENSTTSPVTVLGNTLNNGVINGGFILNSNSTNHGTINGDVVLNDSSINSGTVNGTVSANDSSLNTGIVTGDLIINSISSASGVVTFGTVSNFLGTGRVTGAVKDQTNTPITKWIFNSGSTNSGYTKGMTFFNGTSTNSGTILGHSYFNNSSTNTGTVEGDADVYYFVTTPLGGTVTGSTTYHAYPNTKTFNNSAGDGLWNNSLNWFTDTTLQTNLGGLPGADEPVVLFSSTTLLTNVNNDVYIGANNITIDGVRGMTVDGFISGDGAYDGGDAFNFNLFNLTVTGTTSANGADNSNGVGGKGGDINVSTSTTANIVANGGDGTLGGGDGGTITVTNSVATSSAPNSEAVGGQATYCGSGGNGGGFSSINSSYGTIVNNAGNGTNTGCPNESHGSGNYVNPVVVGVYTPPATGGTTNGATNGGASAGGTGTSGGSTVNTGLINNLNLSNLGKLLRNTDANFGVSHFVNPLARLARLRPPVFRVLPKLSINDSLNRFLTDSLPKNLVDLSDAVPSIKKELTSAGIISGYTLYSMKESPVNTPTLKQFLSTRTLQPLNLMFVSVDGLETPTKLSIDANGNLYQIINVNSYSALGVTARENDKKVVVTFNGKGTKFVRDSKGIVKVNVITPRGGGTHILKIGKMTLEVRVVGISMGTQRTGEVKTAVPIKSPFWWFRENVNNFIKAVGR